jgi:hypothetical protein
VRRCKLLFLCLTLLSLSGCAAMSPPESLVHEDAADTALISASTHDIDDTTFTATLYFRYLDTGMLAAQERVISIPRNTTREKALVQALLDGPGVSAPLLTGVFQAGVSILGAQAVDGVLFITLNDSLLGRYDDEPAELTTPFWKAEAPLRRKLAMTALVAALTETGEYQSVQVLVRGQTQVMTSLRLNKSYFMAGDDSLTGPMTRDETLLLTQANTARIILDAWRQGDVKTLYRFIAAKDPRTGIARPDEQAAYALLGQARPLVGFTVSPGSISQNGQTAILCADITLQTLSVDSASYTAWPMLLIRENGIWKIPYPNLAAMMAIE